MSNVLVAFHSRTGHCRMLAQTLSEQRGWALTEVAWPGVEPGYGRCAIDAILCRAPEIRYRGPDPASFGAVVLVSPIWCWRLNPLMRRFLRSMEGRQRNVAVLSCMGGSGASNAVAEVERLIHRTVVAQLALRQSDVDAGRFGALKAFADQVAAGANARATPRATTVLQSAL